MEIRHIRYFVALAEKLSFTQAAQHLHVTQSTLSHQIGQLEEDLGVRLINRTGRRLSLTPAGQQFLGHANAVLSEIDLAVKQVKRPARKTRGLVRIGGVPSLCIALMPKSIAAFRHTHPDVIVRVEEITAMSVIQQRLVDETLDIGLFYPPVLTDQLAVEPLYEDQVILLVRRDHPLANRKKVRLIDLHGRQVSMPYASAFRQVLEGFLRSVGAEPQVVLETDGFGSLPWIVSETDIASIVSEYAVPRSDVCCAIPVDNPTPTRITSMGLKRNRRLDPAVSAFAACVRQVAGKRRAR
jgi:LysR family transcriptional regulator, cyn operon transcriptional activator